MKLYKCLDISQANKIIIFTNKEFSRYKITKIKCVSDEKIKRCLNAWATIKRKHNLKKTWNQYKVIKSIIFRHINFKEIKKMNNAFIFTEEVF